MQAAAVARRHGSPPLTLVVSTIDILDEAFPRVAAACRRAGVGPPVARIGTAADQYDSEPDAVFDEIRRRTSIFDLKLNSKIARRSRAFCRNMQPW
jgi:hypothetical protein